jgi:hypothetical protein
VESGNDFRRRQDEAGNDLSSAVLRCFPSLVDVGDDGGERDVEHFGDLFISPPPHADGVRHIAADALALDFREFADEVEFIRVLWESGFEGFQVTVRHREHMGGFRENGFGNLSAAETVQGRFAVFQKQGGFRVAWSALGGCDSGGTHLVISASSERLAKEAFRHRAATGIPSTHKQNIFQSGHRGGPWRV